MRPSPRREPCKSMRLSGRVRARRRITVMSVVHGLSVLALSAGGTGLLASAANAGSSTFTSEDLAPPAASEKAQRGVIREELDPVISPDGSGLPYELWSGLSPDKLAESIAQLDLPPR